MSTMNDLKPFAKFGGTQNHNKDAWAERIKGELLPEKGAGLYAIPSTHRVVSVELLENAIKVAAWPEHKVMKAIRAIIDNKE